jgi:two-component SAPR family response regulator
MRRASRLSMNPLYTQGSIEEAVKEIPLTKNKATIVDDEDYEYLSQWKWHLSRFGYAVRKPKEQIYMHRVIMNTPAGMSTDHINKDKTDNQKVNLRICTTSENMMNRDKQKNNTSGYKGVFWHERAGRWRAQIRLNRKSIHLGLFDTPEEACEKYKQAEKEYFGEFAYQNELEVSC